MINNTVKMPFCYADDANIPVNIWLTPEPDENSMFILYADNYHPQTSTIIEHTFEQKSKSRKDLIKVIKAHILPLYKHALSRLDGMCNGTNNSLYYWADPSLPY